MNTCAECKFHICTSNCTKNKRFKCNGYCVLCEDEKLHKRCETSVCKYFVKDVYFTQAFSVVLKYL